MKADYGFIDNSPEETKDLLANPNRTSNLNLAILDKLKNLEMGNSFSVPTPPELSKEASQSASDAAFLNSVRGFLSKQIKDEQYSVSVRLHPQGSKIVVGKVEKRPARAKKANAE